MRVRSIVSLAASLPLFASAFVACGGDSEAPLFGVNTGGAGGLGGASGGAQGGRAGAGAGGSGAIAGSGGSGTSGSAGTAGKAGTGGTGGTAGKAGSGGTSGTSGTAGAAGTAGKAGSGGGATGGAAGKSGAGAGGKAGTAGAAGSTVAGASGSAGAAGGAGASGAAGESGASGASGQAGSGGGGGEPGGAAGAGGATSPCGNGVIDAPEKCDGVELGGATCNSLLGGTTVGTLTCRADCSFDTSACGLCGNGKIDPGEECEDGPDVASGRCGSDCRIKCPDDGKAFGGHCYSRDGTARNWDAARKNCENKQGHLVTITTAAENAVVDGLVGNSFADHWIGFGDGGTEGTFVWVTGEATVLTNWDNNEPNDFANSEDCAHIGNNGKWGDGGCQVPRPSICEIDEPLKK